MRGAYAGDIVLLRYVFHIVEVIRADRNLQAVCLMSALGLAISVAVLPHSQAQLGTRPLLYANVLGGN